MSRSGNADGWHPTYENVEVRITRDEFIAWVMPLLEDWYRTTPTSTPTIDRIENDGHYELGNLRLLPAELNTHYRGSNKNVHAPAGMAWCYLCTSYRPINCFHRDACRPNGRQRRCKDCTYNKYMKGKYRLPDGDEIASIIARHRAGETGYRISKDCGRSMAYVYRIIRKAQA